MTALSVLAPSLGSLVLDASAGPGPAFDAANDEDDARAIDELAALEAIVGDANYQRLGPRHARLALPVSIAAKAPMIRALSNSTVGIAPITS
jgi:hypothetical protein